MNDSSNDISTWTQSGIVERCGMFEERDGMPAKFWGTLKSQLGKRTRYLKVQAWGDVAVDAGGQIAEGSQVFVSGKHGATKNKDGAWSDCLEFRSFIVIGGSKPSDAFSELPSDDECPY